jgi:hypothetical protein
MERLMSLNAQSRLFLHFVHKHADKSRYMHGFDQLLLIPDRGNSDFDVLLVQA